MDPQKGLHKHIAVFDFRSLYPSIIIAHNIDPNTIGCDCCNNTSPEGVNFCLNKKGFIPEILKELTTQTKHKKVLNELADNSIFIKNLEIFNQVAFSSSSSKLSGDEMKFKKLARLMEFESGVALKKNLNSVLQFNRESYSSIILKK